MKSIKTIAALILAAGFASVSFAASDTTQLTPVPKTAEAIQASAETAAHDAARDGAKPDAKAMKHTTAKVKSGKTKSTQVKSTKTPKASATKGKAVNKVGKTVKKAVK